MENNRLLLGPFYFALGDKEPTSVKKNFPDWQDRKEMVHRIFESYKVNFTLDFFFFYFNFHDSLLNMFPELYIDLDFLSYCWLIDRL